MRVRSSVLGRGWQKCEAPGHVPSEKRTDAGTQLASLWPSVIPPGTSVHGSIPSIFRVGLPSVKHLWKPEMHFLGDSASSHVDNEE